MKNKIKQLVIEILQNDFKQFIFLNENLENLVASTTNEKFLKQAEETAKRMNNLGEMSNITLDSDYRPFNRSKIAIEYLMDAYKKNQDEYYLPTIKENIKVNKGNIEKALAIFFHYTAKKMSQFIGMPEKLIRNPEIEKGLISATSGFIKRSGARDTYKQLTGQEVDSGELERMKYYIVKYINSEFDKPTSTFLTYMRNKIIQNIKSYLVRNKHLNLSLDKEIGTDSNGTTHADRLTKKDDNNSTHSHVVETLMQIFADKVTHLINVPMHRLYFKEMALISAERQDLNTARSKGIEMVKRVLNNTTTREFQNSLERLWEEYKQKTGKDISLKDFFILKSKDWKRLSRNALYKNIEKIKDILKEMNLNPDFAPVFIETIIGKGFNAKEQLNKVIQHIKSIANQGQTTDKDYEEDIYGDDYDYEPEGLEIVDQDISDFDDSMLQETEGNMEDLGDNEKFPLSLKQLFSLAQKTGTLQEIRQFIRKTLLESFQK